MKLPFSFKRRLVRYVSLLVLVAVLSIANLVVMQLHVSRLAQQINYKNMEYSTTQQKAAIDHCILADKRKFEALTQTFVTEPNLTEEKVIDILRSASSGSERTVELLFPDNTVFSPTSRILPLDITFEQIDKLGNHYSGRLKSASTGEDMLFHFIPVVRNDSTFLYCCFSTPCTYMENQLTSLEPLVKCALIDSRTFDIIAKNPVGGKHNLRDLEGIFIDGENLIETFHEFEAMDQNVFMTDLPNQKQHLFICFVPTDLDQYYLVSYTQEEAMLSRLAPYRRIIHNTIYIEIFIFFICLVLILIGNRRNVSEAVDEEKKNRADIIEILSGGYTGLYYYNIETDEAEVIYLSDKIKRDTGKSIEILKNLHEVYKNFVNTNVHPDDRKTVIDSLDYDTLKRRLANEKGFTEVFRRNYEGQYLYTRLSVVKAGNERDKPVHIAIGFAEVDTEFKKEQARQIEMSQTLEIAYQDGLTGIKNKYAYRQAEEILDIKLTGANVTPFAIAVFDVNNLKKTNDTLGHEAGDKLICEAAKLICNTFKHSPVYRVGGDEFAVIVTGSDYDDRDMIMLQFRSHMKQNAQNKDGVVVASGIATFIDTDISCSVVFNRADEDMYLNKSSLKK